jgi:thiol-disulfide isomerase/thioredoxin
MGSMSDPLMAETEDQGRGLSGLGLLLFGGIVAGGVMAVFMMFGGAGSPAGTIHIPTPIPDPIRTGQPAPDFASQTPAGDDISLGEFRGSLVAVNFWATWCGPCRSEMPALQEAQKSGRLVVLGVNAGESSDTVTAFMQELDLDFPVVLDLDGAILNSYAIRVFPTTIFVDSEGVVVAEHLGPLTPKLIDQYLSENTDS